MNMKTKLLLLLLLFSFNMKAQLKFQFKIDTTNKTINGLYHFINDYMKQDSISKKYWNPKYKNAEGYNNSAMLGDGLWKYKTPKWITQNFFVKLVELDTINDTLSYFKLLVTNNDTLDNFTCLYKYYITKVAGKYYLDNCKEYETRNFFTYKTKNIIFHCSPLLKNDTFAMIRASNQVDSLCKVLARKPPDSPFDYYMCSSESEMSIICNIEIWDGRVGGITALKERMIISITKDVFYPHEFIHVILGYGTSVILKEGIASYYGGLSQNLTYKDGLLYLRECYETRRCNFDDLYAGKITNLLNSNPRYAFSGAFTQYLIETIGINKFYDLYYNKEITNENFLEKIQTLTHKSKEEIKAGVEKIILGK
jgi:hypothetical protein